MMFFRRRSLGLSLSDRTLEAVALTPRGNTFSLAGLSRVILPPDVVTDGRIMDAERLTQSIDRLFAEAKPAPFRRPVAVVTLPDSQVFTHLFSIAKVALETKNRAELVEAEAAQTIPVPAADLIFDYRVVRDEKGTEDILLIATSRAVLSEWQNLFWRAGVKIVCFEAEILAAYRGLFAVPPREPVIIADLGAATTTLSVFDNSRLWSNRSIKSGGVALTQVISKKLAVELAAAEDAKLKFNLADKDSDLFFVVTKQLGSVVTALKETLDYTAQEIGRPAGEVVLVGGGSRLGGLADYLTVNLNVPTRLGAVPGLKESQIYIQALGAALRHLPGSRWNSQDPSFPAVLPLPRHPRPSARPNFFRRRRGRQLLAVIVIGGLFLAGAFWFRSYDQNQWLKLRQLAEERLNNLPIYHYQPSATSTPAVEKTPTMVTITKTPTGWLNVRAAASISAPIIGRVWSRKSYPLIDIEQNAGWYKIKLANGQAGWVSGRYVLTN